jgi:cobalamin synthase
LSFAFLTPAVLIWVIVVGPVLAATLQWGLSRRSGSLGGDIIGASICATELFLLLSFQALI